MEDIFKTLPHHTCSWLKGKLTLFKYQGYWNTQEFIEGGILAQQSYKAQPTDVFLCSCPKTGTTWLKALAFAIVTRQKFDKTTTPLLTTMPHECVPFLEKDLDKINENQNKSSLTLVGTHLPYTCLPESVIASNCKIVYVYRNVKDVVVSYYSFMRDVVNVGVEDAAFEEFFNEFCEGVSWYGPYWDHILRYWKASKERPSRIVLLKYEDMKRNTASEVKKLAEFIGYPFSVEEERSGVIENIVKMCSFENLKNLEVNKSGKHRPEDEFSVENRLYFRKAKDGDWKNYLTYEMKEKIDKLMDQKLSETDLVLK